MNTETSPKLDSSSAGAGVLVLTVMHGIPIVGILLLGWSAALVLMIYLMENVLTVQRWNSAIDRHRRMTRKRGHYGTDGTDLDGYRKAFSLNANGLTLVHALVGLPVVMIVGDGMALLAKPLWILLIFSVCAAATWFDLVQRTRGIETRSFAWLESNVNRVWWDIHSMHFGLFIGGIWLMSDGTANWMVIPVIALRAWISYKQHRPFVGLQDRRPTRWEIGISNPTDEMIRQWRDSMIERARRLEEAVPSPSADSANRN